MPFITCCRFGGLTNQRISIIQATIIAISTNRSLILPSLNANGAASGFQEMYNSSYHSIDKIYDVNHFAKYLHRTYKLQVALSNKNVGCLDSCGNSTPLRCYKSYSDMVKNANSRHRVLSLKRTFFAVKIDESLKDMFWSIDE